MPYTMTHFGYSWNRCTEESFKIQQNFNKLHIQVRYTVHVLLHTPEFFNQFDTMWNQHTVISCNKTCFYAFNSQLSVLIVVRSHSVLFLHLLPILFLMAHKAYHQNIFCGAMTPLAVPAGWGFLRRGRSGICYKCQLPNIHSPLER